MTRGIARFFVHTVTVEAFTGKNGNGQDTFAAPITVVGFYDGTQKQSRTPDGEIVTSSSTFYTAKTNLASFPADARVTFGSIVSRVSAAQLLDSGSLNLPDHAAISLI